MTWRRPTKSKGKPQNPDEIEWEALKRNGWNKSWEDRSSISVLHGPREIISLHGRNANLPPSSKCYLGARTLGHMLVSAVNEPNKRANHIHLKYYSNWGADWDGSEQHFVSEIDEWLLVRTKFENLNNDNQINRRVLIDKINSLTNLNLNYKN